MRGCVVRWYVSQINRGATVCLGLALLSAMSIATRPAIAADETTDDLIALVIGLLRDQDKDLRALGLEQVRSEAPGANATKQFADELSKLADESQQVGLLRALGDRGDSAALPGIRKMVTHTAEDVRVAAYAALGSLGELQDAKLLVERLFTGSDTEQLAVRQALERIPGSDISRHLITLLGTGEDRLQTTIMSILVTRHASEAVPELLQVATGDSAQVRQAAMVALGEMAAPEHVAAMIPAVLKAPRGAERAAAEKAVMFVCRKEPDPDKQPLPLLEGLKPLAPADRLAMLSTLGRIGGKPALEPVEQAIASRQSADHSAGITALSNWPDASVANRLIQLVKQDPHPPHRITALRALIRVAPLSDHRSDADRLGLLKEAMELSTQSRERNFVLERLQAIRTVETLRYVLPYTNQASYREQACETIVELAHHRALRDAHKDEFHAALDKVMMTTKDATLIERSRRYKNNQTWVRPK